VTTLAGCASARPTCQAHAWSGDDCSGRSFESMSADPLDQRRRQGYDNAPPGARTVCLISKGCQGFILEAAFRAVGRREGRGSAGPAGGEAGDLAGGVPLEGVGADVVAGQVALGLTFPSSYSIPYPGNPAGFWLFRYYEVLAHRGLLTS